MGGLPEYCLLLLLLGRFHPCPQRMPVHPTIWTACQVCFFTPRTAGKRHAKGVSQVNWHAESGGLAGWRSWPLLRPTTTVLDAERELRPGHLRCLPLSSGWLKPSSKNHGRLSLPATSSRCSGSVQASEQGHPSVGLGRAPGLPTSSSIPSYAPGCTASRIRGWPFFRP